jgi:DNA-directed RNA polymerase delta subunit
VRNATYRRAIELLEADLNDELVALEPNKGACFGFNPVAKDIWRKLERPRSFDDLRREILAEYDVSSEQCTRELRQLLDDMVVKGLIEPMGKSGN